jgi:Holliday junction resolvase RusA-like endonuclease
VFRSTLRTETAGAGLRPSGRDQAAYVIEVLGTPAPKGSVRAFFKPGMARAMIVKDNKDPQRAWDASVREAAYEAVGKPEAPPFVDVALEVTITFRITRPGGHWGKGKNAGKLAPTAPRWPRVKPDIDKLARSTLDALTGIVFDDDARIVDLKVRKEYAAPGREGAWIGVTPVSEDRTE